MEHIFIFGFAILLGIGMESTLPVKKAKYGTPKRR